MNQPSTPISDAVRVRIDKMFPPSIRPEVVALLETRCGTSLPGFSKATPGECDRIRFAVLKLSCGNFVRLLAAVADANIDWRDTLMAAGFGYDAKAHESWFPA